MLTFILFIPAIICYIALFATYMPQAKYKNGMLFAVILPAHVIMDSRLSVIQVHFKKHFAKLSLWMAGFLIPFLILHWWSVYQVLYFLIWLIVFVVIMGIPFRRAFRDTLTLKLENEWFVGTKTINTDEDEYWANGFTYHNPMDRRVLVPKRVGVGLTVNTGTLTGKIIMRGLIGLVAVVIIGVSFLLIRSELVSPTLTITPDHRIEIDYPMYSFHFNSSEIIELKLVNQVPSGTKTNGEATGKNLRGQFRLKELGKSRLYIVKNNPPYIQIKLKDVYIFYNEKDPLHTKQQYEQLQMNKGAN